MSPSESTFGTENRTARTRLEYNIAAGSETTPVETTRWVEADNPAALEYTTRECGMNPAAGIYGRHRSPSISTQLFAASSGHVTGIAELFNGHIDEFQIP